ncbi:MAG: LamG-like jellyroll fold domain-containing protein [Balneolaceae bacterium]
MQRLSLLFLLLSLLATLPSTLSAQISPPANDGLLFYLSGDNGFTADVAHGKATPNFLNDVEIIDDGAVGRAFRNHHFTQHFVYDAPGNMYAQRGTFSFYWRPREYVGEVPFIIARTGPSDGSALIMNFLRIDYNGMGGFDAFVEDPNYGVVRVRHTSDTPPEAGEWYHLALTWDETVGVRLYLDGDLIASEDAVTIFDTGLDQFGVGKRGISPIYVGNEGHSIRGADFDEYKIYDRMLEPEQIRRLARGEDVRLSGPLVRDLAEPRWQNEWSHRYGWNRSGDLPAPLPSREISIRKVEVHDAYDLKQWFWKGNDGIRETIWPGAYNRSRISDRHQYIVQPDWNIYSESGKSVTYTMPDEPYNHIEIAGAAFGSLSRLEYDREHQQPSEMELFRRPEGQERTVHRLNEQFTGGKLRFDNDVQEMAIGKFEVYNIEPGRKPAGRRELIYHVDPSAAPDNVTLEDLNRYIEGRYTPDERSRVVALPSNAPRRPKAEADRHRLPLVHIMIPFEFRREMYDSQGYSGISSSIPRTTQTWENMNAGLDGIELKLPALDVEPGADGTVVLNIRILDPIWPDRSMMDVTASVVPGEEHTLWLDTRDRILPNDHSLYLRIASSASDFDSADLDGTEVNLVFKSYDEAKEEHVADRFIQAKDNAAHIAEPGTNSKLLRAYQRFSRDLEDLFRVEPQHEQGRQYWYWRNRGQGTEPYVHTTPPDGVPEWAHRQVELLGQVRHFTEWWLDNRMISNGEFGGGLSDDGDLTPQFVVAAMLGVAPDRITDSIDRIMDAYYDNGMFTEGLATIMADELHAYEEGIQVLTQDFHLSYGDPLAVERLMETSAALERLTGINDKGHRQFISNFYSGSKIADETVWNWQYPYNFLILTPGVTLVEYNGNEQIKELILELVDGLVSQYEKPGDRINTIVHYPSGEPNSEYDPGLRNTSHLLWAAWRWTGDQKYLEPLLDYGTSVFGMSNSNLLDILDLRDTLGEELAESSNPHRGGSFQRHLAWMMTGNTQYLEELYEDEIASNAALMYVNTEGHLWTDRVGVSSSSLQRARMGGLGPVRSGTYAGHLVRWRFNEPARAEDVAIAIREGSLEHAVIEAFNLKRNEAVHAQMEVWDLAPGVWEVTQRTEGPDGEVTTEQRAVELERMDALDLRFEPMAETTLTLRLVEEYPALQERADLGIGPESVERSGNRINVTVHNLGAVESPDTEIAFIDDQGEEVDRRSVSSIAPPNDLQPKTDRVRLRVPSGTSGYLILDPDEELTEITRYNNRLRID